MTLFFLLVLVLLQSSKVFGVQSHKECQAPFELRPVVLIQPDAAVCCIPLLEDRVNRVQGNIRYLCKPPPIDNTKIICKSMPDTAKIICQPLYQDCEKPFQKKNSIEDDIQSHLHHSVTHTTCCRREEHNGAIYSCLPLLQDSDNLIEDWPMFLLCILWLSVFSMYFPPTVSI
jgi:hypothetical protein